MIELYTIHCPACIVLQKKMDMKKLAYEVITDEAVFEAKGITHFPMISVDGGPLMNFSDARKWVDAQEA